MTKERSSMTTQPTEQRDVAADFMAVMAGSRAAGASQPQTSGAGAPAVAGEPVFAPWGAVTDPHEAIRVFEADPQTRAALFDSGNPLHEMAVKRRAELYAAAYGEERADTIQGNGYGGMSPAIYEGYQEPTEAEMQAAYTATAAGILQRYGADPDTAQSIAQTLVGAGLSTVEIAEVSQAIDSSPEYASPEAAIAALGPNASEIIRAAQQEANALRLPAELLNMPVGIDGGIVLGEHPELIRALARRRGVR